MGDKEMKKLFKVIIMYFVIVLSFGCASIHYIELKKEKLKTIKKVAAVNEMYHCEFIVYTPSAGGGLILGAVSAIEDGNTQDKYNKALEGWDFCEEFYKMFYAKLEKANYLPLIKDKVTLAAVEYDARLIKKEKRKTKIYDEYADEHEVYDYRSIYTNNGIDTVLLIGLGHGLNTHKGLFVNGGGDLINTKDNTTLWKVDIGEYSKDKYSQDELLATNGKRLKECLMKVGDLVTDKMINHLMNKDD